MNRSNTQLRLSTFEIVERDAVGRIPVVVSTDAVVEVADGPEILDHSPGAVDLSRAPLPIIATHRGGQINIGVVEDITLANGQMRGYARFGARDEAAGYEADVLNRIIRSVSVGYARIKATVRKDGTLHTTRWMPTHTALVAEPADINAGFFREMAAAPDFEISDEAADPAPVADQTPGMSYESLLRDCSQSNYSSSRMGLLDDPIPITPTVQITRTQSAAPAVIVSKGQIMSQQDNAGGQSAGKTDSAAQERLRIKTLTDLGRQHRVDDETVRAWIDDEAVSVDDAARRVLDIMVARSGDKGYNPAEIGMSKKEAEKYSTFKAIRSILNKDWSRAGLELEAHKAIQQRLGGNPLNEQTFYVPLEAQASRKHREIRDMTSAGTSGSNYLVGTENMSFIDLLRNRSVTMKMGAARLGGLQGNVSVPRQTASASTTWLTNEATAITEGQPTIGQMLLSPKHVGAYTEISRLLALQSSPDAETLVMNDLAKAVALAADLAGLAGTGAAGQPTGIIGTAGVGSVVGTAMAYAGMLEFQTDIGNALAASCGYVTTPQIAALLMQRVKFAGTASPLWDGNILEAIACGFRGMSSAQVPVADIVFGAWDQLVIAEWGSLAIEVNPYANFQAGLVGVRALYAMDIGVRVPAAFSVATVVT